ncbi:MAG: S8 family serine peptidase [Candidatus Paceibacterota bacterium]
MPRKKYKHIKIPGQLFSSENTYTAPPRRNFKALGEFNREKQQQKVLSGVNRISSFFSKKEESFKIDTDKQTNEIKIKFYGPVNPDFLSKYRIQVYRQEENREKNTTIYGKISSKSLDGGKSDFGRLQDEAIAYVEEGKLKSYFEKIREIKPLTLEEIIEKELKRKMKTNPSQEVFIDVSFADKQNIANTKIDAIKEQFPEKFISKVNTELLHFCRMKAKFNDVEVLHKNYEGIIEIEQSPDYTLIGSSLERNIDDFNILPPLSNGEPAFVFDGAVNDQHVILRGAMVGKVGLHTGNKDHATAVASLVVCGHHLNITGSIQQDNKVIAVDLSEGGGYFLRLEERLIEAIERNAANYQMMLINFSINNYIYYNRKKVDKLTKLLDELSYKYNCLFFISVGNLFDRDWGANEKRMVKAMGYPNYFKLPICRIIPPSDSINNISVGSIAYQESVDSITKIKNPVVITRANLDAVPFIKPDFVHYDSNHKRDFSCEYNGVYLASKQSDKLTKASGTSFAAPLVLHEACLLHNFYPEYNKDTIKALLIHFAESIRCDCITNETMKKKLSGFGMPNLEKAMYSLNSSSTLVIEDEIGINKKKTIKFPIPSCISGSSRKRLKVRKTLVYSSPINHKNVRTYNPINISVQFIREDQKNLDSFSTRNSDDGAHTKSNVKCYPALEVSTMKHTGNFWELNIFCESKDNGLPSGYKQPYSIILSIEDMQEDDSIDLHQEVLSMIQIETSIEIPLEA